MLITGGAGFIGSNLVERLLSDSQIELVRVLDNLSTGFLENVEEFNNHPKFEFVNGDIRNFDDCMESCKGIDIISHQAALGSVPRSIKDPITTNNVNITGTLNMFQAAKENNIARVVYAASSSTYGDSIDLPKQEDRIGLPLSPYAVTKYVNELYARVFSDVYGQEYIGLRYFNIFGPRQHPSGAYAAVIPLFAQALMNNRSPIIHGDGEQSRDFTFVDNAVNANLLALFTENPSAINQVYNVACGKRTTIIKLYEILKSFSTSTVKPIHEHSRQGDVKHSLADISKANNLLNYDVSIQIEEGLRITYDWFIGKSGMAIK